MRRFLIICVVIVLAGCSAVSTEDNNHEHETSDTQQEMNESTSIQTSMETEQNNSKFEIADRFNKHLKEGIDRTAEENFNYSKEMYDYFEQVTIIDMFASLKVGSVISQQESKMYVKDVYTIIVTPTVFENGEYDLNLVFNSENEIAGISISEFTGQLDNEGVAADQSYIEIEKDLIGNGDALPGVLTLPSSKGEYPCVILVHGSGASDKDETILLNKPFRDLAHGLAELGIASYRYDKRSYVYPEYFTENMNYTLIDETVNDVNSAYNMLTNVQQVKQSEIFILGHSLGGYAIPLIHQAVDAQGYIIMAGNVRSLDELIAEQVDYLTQLDGSVSDDEQAYINKLRAQLELLEQINILNDHETILGAPTSYWKFLDSYDPLQEADKINKQVLVLQGERDYQVTMKDFNLWKDTFKSNVNWTFNSYTKLNHLMMPGEGQPSNMEYNIANKVSEEVIKDIATWINKK